MSFDKYGEWLAAALTAGDRPRRPDRWARFRFEAWIDFETGSLMFRKDNITAGTAINAEISRYVVEDHRPTAQLEAMVLGATHLITKTRRATVDRDRADADRARADALAKRLAAAEATTKRLARLKRRSRR